MANSQIPQAVEYVSQQGEVSYADVLAQFDHVPTANEMKILRERLDFSLRADDSGNIQHVVKPRQDGA